MLHSCLIEMGYDQKTFLCGELCLVIVLLTMTSTVTLNSKSTNGATLTVGK